jgi:hypothetical protein
MFKKWKVMKPANLKEHQGGSHITFLARPQGEWRDADGNFVPLDKDGCTTASAWCSNCGEWLTGSDEYWTSGRFCPNCGCRMKGADDE